MAKRVQLIRHDPGDAATFGGLEGEVTVELTNNRLRLHDGSTPGGHVIPNLVAIQALLDDLSLALTGDIEDAFNLAMHKSIMTASNQVLVSTGANTEGVVAMPASRMLARLATGNTIAATPAEIRTLLSLVPGTDVQAYSAKLAGLTAIGTAAAKLIKQTGVNTFGEIPLGAMGETLAATADAAAVRTAISVYSKAEIDAVLDVIDDALANLIVTGTKMLFAQATAPTGWTQDTTLNDRVIRVVSGAGAGTGGSWTISGLAVEDTTLTTAQMPAHSHRSGQTESGHNATGNTPVGYPLMGLPGSQFTSVEGGGLPHGHTLTIGNSWRPAYVDVIICTKNAP